MSISKSLILFLLAAQALALPTLAPQPHTPESSAITLPTQALTTSTSVPAPTDSISSFSSTMRRGFWDFFDLFGPGMAPPPNSKARKAKRHDGHSSPQLEPVDAQDASATSNDIDDDINSGTDNGHGHEIENSDSAWVETYDEPVERQDCKLDMSCNKKM